METLAKYENVDLVVSEVEALQEIEKQFGTPITHIDRIAWDDYKIDPSTRQVEKFRQHQFGFMAENGHVIALGLSFNSINKSDLKTPSSVPKLSKLPELKYLDINHWGRLFDAYIKVYNQRQEEFQTSLHQLYRTPEERREAQSKAQRNLYQPINAISFSDLEVELKSLQKLTYLDISHCHLSLLKFLKNLANVEVLDLSSNEIDKIEDSLDTMINLHTLYLANNPIKKYPESLMTNKMLKILDLSNTQIQELPDNLGDLEFLEELRLPIHILGFPQSFIHLKNLKTLVTNDFPDVFKTLDQLETLMISSGEMETISEGIIGLKALKTLVISNCRFLKALPEKIGELEALEELMITGNSSLEVLPNSIFDLSKLKTLNLYNNNLKNFPDELGRLPYLEIITLANNQLRYLPYSVFKLNNLIDFSIDNNPLDFNDKLISAKTLPEIKAYGKKKVAIKVFISHAVADYESCRLEELGSFLESQLEVDTAFLCERDLSGNIDEFMDKNIPKSQLTLFIATTNSVVSKDCQYELQLSRDYDVQIVPIKAIDLDWNDLVSIDLNRELGMECNFANNEFFENFKLDLYTYIKQLKRQIDLHNKEQAKIDRLTTGLKAVERKLNDIIQRLTELENH